MEEGGVLEKTREALAEQRVSVRAFKDSDLTNTLQCDTELRGPPWQLASKGEHRSDFSPVSLWSHGATREQTHMAASERAWLKLDIAFQI